MNRAMVLLALLAVVLLAVQAGMFVHVLGRMARLEQAASANPAADTGARASVAIGSLPLLGPENAPITIVEFSDYECPFCAAVEPVVHELLKRYPGQVRLAYRDFPLTSIHKQAATAAHAARCAADQDQFWAYHDLVFQGGPAVRQQATAPAALGAYARELTLNLDEFDQCMESRRHLAAIEADIAEGQRLGVNGTPAFFINGRVLKGARPLEEFVRIIEEELAAIRTP